VYLLRFQVQGRDECIVALDRPLNIGRAENNDLVLGDPEVSRCHASLRPGSEGAILRDLGSHNGTFVGEQRISNATLHSGNSFVIGSTHFLLEQRSAGWETSSPVVQLKESVAVRRAEDTARVSERITPWPASH